jgi:ligand-binding SRPBCC domain-containing protein
MPIIEFCTSINAPVEICFDLARDIDLHTASTVRYGRKSSGRDHDFGTVKCNFTCQTQITSGLLNLGEEVTWEATHLWIRQRLTSRITSFDRPRHFRDSQISGAFRRFDHDHYFRVESGSTVMRDVFDCKRVSNPSMQELKKMLKSRDE